MAELVLLFFPVELECLLLLLFSQIVEKFISINVYLRIIKCFTRCELTNQILCQHIYIHVCAALADLSS